MYFIFNNDFVNLFTNLAAGVHWCFRPFLYIFLCAHWWWFAFWKLVSSTYHIQPWFINCLVGFISIQSIFHLICRLQHIADILWYVTAHNNFFPFRTGKKYVPKAGEAIIIYVFIPPVTYALPGSYQKWCHSKTRTK